jgi:hypothetical protein
MPSSAILEDNVGKLYTPKPNGHVNTVEILYNHGDMMRDDTADQDNAAITY